MLGEEDANAYKRLLQSSNVFIFVYFLVIQGQFSHKYMLSGEESPNCPSKIICAL